MFRPIIGITSYRLDEPCARAVVNQTYMDAVITAGGVPLCIPPGLDPEGVQRVSEVIDGLLLSGGVDVAPSRYGAEPHPHLGDVDESRDRLEIALTTLALAADLPILGICRGIQLLAVAAGGTLYQDIPTEVDSAISHDVRLFGKSYLAHDIQVTPSTLLHQMIGCTSLQVNSFHHQAVRDLPSDFMVSARAQDGIIEAIEAPHHRFVVGVQCHPEEIWNSSATQFAGLFGAFVEAARERQPSVRPPGYVIGKDDPTAA